MADKEEIKIEIDLGLRNADGTSKSVKELTKYFKELKNQISDTSDGASLEALNKKLNAVEGKLGDINDAAKLVAGSGVEKLNASFGALQEGLGNADFDKVKMGFKGLGAAMDALPIFLIIEGLKMLIENFEAIYKFFQSFSDSAKEVARLEKEVARLEVSTAKQKTTLEGLVSIQEAQLDLMKEQGKGSKEIAAQEEKIFNTKLELIKVEGIQLKASAQLHLAKLQEIQDNDSLYEGMQRIEAQVQRALGNDIVADAIDKTIAQNKKERSEESQKAFDDAMNRVKQLTDEVAVLTINREKDKTAAVNASTEAWKKSEEDKAKKAEQQGEENYRRWKEEQERMAAEEAVVIPEQKQAIAQTEIEIEAAKNAELLNQSALKYEAEEKLRLEAKAKSDAAILQAEQKGIDAARSLTAGFFAWRARAAKGNAEEELKIKKQMFQVDKAFNLARAIQDGIRSVQAALTIPPPGGQILAGVNAAIAAGNIAKIAASQFDGGASSATLDVNTGGSSSGLAGAGSQPSFQAPTFFGLGQVSGGGSNQKQAQQVFVTEGDISKVQKRVSVIESRSRIN